MVTKKGNSKRLLWVKERYFSFSRYFKLKSLILKILFCFISHDPIYWFWRSWWRSIDRIRSVQNPATICLYSLILELFFALLRKMMAHLHFRHITLLFSMMLRILHPIYLTWKLTVTIIPVVYSKVQPDSFWYAYLLQRRNNKIIFFKCCFLILFPNFPQVTLPEMNLYSKYRNIAAFACPYFCRCYYKFILFCCSGTAVYSINRY